MDITPQFNRVPATYLGTRIPLHGIATLTTTRSGLSAEIEDREGWQHRMIAELPSGTVNPSGAIFRSIVPGRLVGAEGHGRIEPDAGGWTADDVFYVSTRSHYSPTEPSATFLFHIGSLTLDGTARGSPVAAVRFIYAGGGWSHVTEFGERAVVVRAVSESATSIEEEALSVTIEGDPDDIDSEAIWLWASLISGNSLGALLTEFYAEDGALIRQVHRRGNLGTERHRFFRPFYAPFSPAGMREGLLGFARCLRSGFPIEVIMDHILQAAAGNIDVDAVHLTLANHTALEAWNREHGFEKWIDGRVWNRFANHIFNDLIPQAMYETIGPDLTANVQSALRNAARTTTGWRQARFYDALGIDVSGADAKRTLRMRNELLHNGYFLQRWHELSPEQAQRRRDDVERLRRLALCVVFRLIGYSGPFLDPVTFQLRNMPSRAESFTAR